MSYERKYFIQDTRDYVGNACVWWQNNANGYTCDIRLAGVFSETEATSICANRETDKKWQVNDIMLIIKPIIDGQDLHRLKIIEGLRKVVA